LKESGIDLDHNRFLILQGEVEQIAMMKPRGQHDGDEGMLEFLEDVIGSSRLKAPIDELGRKVDLLNEARGDKVNRVKAVEREKNDLEAAKTEAEEYLALQADVAKKQCILYQKYIMECRGFEKQAELKRNDLEEQISPLKDQLRTLKEETKEREKDLNNKLKMHEKLLEEIESCKSVLVSYEQRDISARQELKNAKANLKKVGKNLEKENEKLKGLEDAPEKCQKDIEEAKDQIELLESRREVEERKLFEVLANLKTATQGLQEEKEGYELELIELNQGVNEAKAKVDVAKAELDLFNEKSTSLHRQLDEARKKLADTSTQIKACKEGISRLKKDIPSKKEAVTACEDELRSLSAAESKLTEQVKLLRSQVEEGTSSLDAFKSRSKVLQTLLQQKESGEIPGVCGRLGDLGTISDRYDVAISTACAALDHVVVDTMETAVKCVAYLKRSGVGSATFIGLDKVEHLREIASRRMQGVEDVPRLFDLVKPKDDRYAPAFYFALRNTLVADDLEQATRIGMKGKTRHRVVTLSGQLIDSSGTMSGGGNRVLKGRMSSKASSDVSPLQVEEKKKRLEDNERALAECSQRKDSTQEELKGLKKEVSEMEKDLKKYQVDDQLLVEQEEAVKKRMEELQSNISHLKVNTTALKALEAEVEKFSVGYHNAASKASAVEEKVQRLNAKIMEAGGSRVQSQQAKVDEIVKEIDGLHNRITKANVTIKTSARNATKCRGRVASLEQDVEGTEAAMARLREELRNLEDQAVKMLEKHKELVSKAKEDEATLSSEKAKVERASDDEVSIECKMMDLCHEQDKYVAKMKENQHKIKHFEGQITKLNLKESCPQPSKEELQDVDTKKEEYEITIMEERLKQMTPNMAAIDEYKKKEEVYLQRLGELNAMTAERDIARKEFDDLRKLRLDEFMAGFGVITSKLKEMYQMITLGGDAELELVDSLDPFSEGIVFSVRPPKKSWKNISNLSGGEKTLSSLALVFALHHYKPSPLYVMDEIDAALDYRNVSIIAHYIKERTKNAQFIIISLRNNMFELADHLVGIYKTCDSTKTVVINPRTLTGSSEPLRERNTGTAEH
jgi:structural maintenance of chromosome 4